MSGREANSPSTNENHGSSRLRFGSVAICFGSKLTDLNDGDLNRSRRNLTEFRLISLKFGWISTDLIEIQLDLDRPHRDLVRVAFGERSPVGSIGLCFSCEDPPTDSQDSGSENENPSPTVAGGGLGGFRSRLDGLGRWVGSWVRMDSPSQGDLDEVQLLPLYS